MVERKLTKTTMILNDQGGSVIEISEDVTACLRAQDHGHPPVVCFVECNSHLYANDETAQTIRAKYRGIPVICFEPGIARREGNDNRFVIDKCCTLRADMGDNQPAVCFQQNQLEMESFTNANRVKCMNPWDPQSKRQYRTDGICYAIEGHGVRPSHMGNGYHDDGTMYTLNTIEQHCVCYELGKDV